MLEVSVLEIMGGYPFMIWSLATDSMHDKHVYHLSSIERRILRYVQFTILCRTLTGILYRQLKACYSRNLNLRSELLERWILYAIFCMYNVSSANVGHQQLRPCLPLIITLSLH